MFKDVLLDRLENMLSHLFYLNDPEIPPTHNEEPVEWDYTFYVFMGIGLCVLLTIIQRYYMYRKNRLLSMRLKKEQWRLSMRNLKLQTIRNKRGENQTCEHGFTNVYYKQLPFKYSSKTDTKEANLFHQISRAKPSQLQKQTTSPGMVSTVLDDSHNLGNEEIAGKAFSGTKQSKHWEASCNCERCLKRHHSSEKQEPFATKTLAIVPSLTNSMLEKNNCENSPRMAHKQTCKSKKFVLLQNTAILPLSDHAFGHHEKSSETVPNSALVSSKASSTQNSRSHCSTSKAAKKKQYKLYENASPEYTQDYTDSQAYCVLSPDSGTETISKKTKPKIAVDSMKMLGCMKSSDLRKNLENNSSRMHAYIETHTNSKAGIANTPSSVQTIETKSQEERYDAYSMHQNICHNIANDNTRRISTRNNFTQHYKPSQFTMIQYETRDRDQETEESFQMRSISTRWPSDIVPRDPIENTVLRGMSAFKNRQAEQKALHDEQCQPLFAAVNNAQNNLESESKDYTQMSENYPLSQSKTKMLTENCKDKKCKACISFTSREQENIHMVESLLSVKDLNSTTFSNKKSTEDLMVPSQESKTVQVSLIHSAGHIINSQYSTIICPSLNYTDLTTQPLDSWTSSRNSENMNTDIQIKCTNPRNHTFEMHEKCKQQSLGTQVPSPTRWNSVTTMSEKYGEKNKLDTRSGQKCENRLTNSSMEFALSDGNNLDKNSRLLCSSMIMSMCEKLHKHEEDQNSLTPGESKSKTKAFPTLLEFLNHMEHETAEKKLKEREKFIRPLKKNAREKVQTKCTSDQTHFTLASKQSDNIDMQQQRRMREINSASISFSQMIAQNQFQQQKRSASEQIQNSVAKESFSLTNDGSTNITNVPSASEYFKPQISDKKTNKVKKTMFPTQKNEDDQAEITSSMTSATTFKERSGMRFSKKNILKKWSNTNTRKLSTERLNATNELLHLIHVSGKDYQHNFDPCKIKNMRNPVKDINSRSISTASQKCATDPDTTVSVSGALWSCSAFSKGELETKERHHVPPECKRHKSIRSSKIDNKRKSHIPIKMIPTYGNSYQGSEASKQTYTLTYPDWPGTRTKDFGKHETITQVWKAPHSKKKSECLTNDKYYDCERIKVQVNSIAPRMPLDKSQAVSFPKTKRKSLIPVRKTIQNIDEPGEEREASLFLKDREPIDPGNILLDTSQDLVNFNPDKSLVTSGNNLKPAMQNVYTTLKMPVSTDVKNRLLGKIPLYNPDKDVNTIQKSFLKSKTTSSYFVHTIDYSHREKTDSEKQIKETQQVDVGLGSSSTDRILSNKSTVSINSLERPEGTKYVNSSYTSKYRTKDNRSLKLAWRGTNAFRKRLQCLLQSNKNIQNKQNKNSVMAKENIHEPSRARRIGLLVTGNENIRTRRQNQSKVSKDSKEHQDYPEQSCGTSNKSPYSWKKDRTCDKNHGRSVKYRRNIEMVGENSIPIRERLAVSDTFTQTMMGVSIVSPEIKGNQASDTDALYTVCLSDTGKTNVNTLGAEKIEFKTLSSVFTELKRKKRPEQQLKYLMRKRCTYEKKSFSAYYNDEIAIHSDTSPLAQEDDEVKLLGSSVTGSKTKRQKINVINLSKERQEKTDLALQKENEKTVDHTNDNLILNSYAGRHNPTSEQAMTANMKTLHMYENSGIVKWDLLSCEDDDILDMDTDAAHSDFFVGERDLIFARDATKARKLATKDIKAVGLPVIENHCGLVDKTNKKEIVGLAKYKTHKQDTNVGIVLPVRLLESNIKHICMKNQLEDVQISQRPDVNDLLFSRPLNEDTSNSFQQTVSNFQMNKDIICKNYIQSDNWCSSNDDRTASILQNQNVNDLCKHDLTSGTGKESWNAGAGTIMANSTESEDIKLGMMATDWRTKLAQLKSANLNSANDSIPEIRTVQNTSLITINEDEFAKNTVLNKQKTNTQSKLSPCENQITFDVIDQPSKAEELSLNTDVIRLMSHECTTGRVKHRKSKTFTNILSDHQESSPSEKQYVSQQTEFWQGKHGIFFLHSSLGNTTSVGRLDSNHLGDVQSSIGRKIEIQQNAPHETMCRLHCSSGYTTIENIVPTSVILYQNNWPFEQILSPKPTVDQSVEFVQDTVQPFSQTLGDQHDTHVNILSVSSRQNRAMRKDNNDTALADSQMIHLQIDNTVGEHDHKYHAVGSNDTCAEGNHPPDLQSECYLKEKTVDKGLRMQRPYSPRMSVDTASQLLKGGNNIDNYSHCSITSNTADSLEDNAGFPKDAENKHHCETSLHELDNTVIISGKINDYLKGTGNERKLNLSYQNTHSIDFPQTYATHDSKFSQIKDTRKSIHRSLKDIGPPNSTSLDNSRTHKVLKDNEEFEIVVKSINVGDKCSIKRSILENTDEVAYQHSNSDIHRTALSRRVSTSSESLFVSSTSIPMSSQSQTYSSCSQYESGSQFLNMGAVTEDQKQCGHNIKFQTATDINTAFPRNSRNCAFQLSRPHFELFNSTMKKESQNHVTREPSRTAIEGNCEVSDIVTKTEKWRQSSFVSWKNQRHHSTFPIKSKSSSVKEVDYVKPVECSDMSKIETTIQSIHSEQTLIRLLKSLNNRGTIRESAFGTSCTSDEQVMIQSSMSIEHENAKSHRTNELANNKTNRNSKEAPTKTYKASEQSTKSKISPSDIDKTIVEDNYPYSKLTSYRLKKHLTFVCPYSVKSIKHQSNQVHQTICAPLFPQKVLNEIKSTTDANPKETIDSSRSKSRVMSLICANAKELGKKSKKSKSDLDHYHITNSEEETFEQVNVLHSSDTSHVNSKDGDRKTSNRDEQIQIQGQGLLKNDRHSTRKQLGNAAHLKTETKEGTVFKADDDLESLLNRELSRVTSNSGIRERREIIFTKQYDREKRKGTRRRSRKSSSPLSCNLDLYYHFLRENDGSIIGTSPSSCHQTVASPSDTTTTSPKRPRKLQKSARFTKLEEFIQKAEKEISRTTTKTSGYLKSGTKQSDNNAVSQNLTEERTNQTFFRRCNNYNISSSFQP